MALRGKESPRMELNNQPGLPWVGGPAGRSNYLVGSGEGIGLDGGGTLVLEAGVERIRRP